MLKYTINKGEFMKKSLLIVDVQNGFINENTKKIPELVEQLQKGYDNIYITRFYSERNSFFEELINWKGIYKNSEDFELSFKPDSKAIIIDKSIYTCINERFILDIKSKEINSIDICGLDTDICVTKCAVDLFELGIVPVVLKDYCASSAGYENHKNALITLKRFIGKNQIK